MAEIIESGGKKHGGKKRPKKHESHVDMTPMVDLACLLVTFFMLTTAFSKPKVIEIGLPDKITKNNEVKQKELDKDLVVNVILDNNKIYWYNGLANKKNGIPPLEVSNFSKDGIRKMLLKRNKDLFVKIEEYNLSVTKSKVKISKDTIEAKLKKIRGEDKFGPVVLIKAGENVKYGNLVDIIDEMAICNIFRYAIVDINDIELGMLVTARGPSKPAAVTPPSEN